MGESDGWLVLGTFVKEVWQVTMGAIIARLNRRRIIATLTPELVEVLAGFATAAARIFPTTDGRIDALITLGVLLKVPTRHDGGENGFVVYPRTVMLSPFYRTYLNKIGWFRAHSTTENNSSNFQM